MITKRLTPGLAGYVALIIIGLFLPTVAVLGISRSRSTSSCRSD